MAGDIVLLTGATGTIGFKTLVLLLEAGYTVRAATRNQAGFDKISSLSPIAKHKSQLSSFIVPDITIPGAFDEAVKGVTYIPAIRGTVGILDSANKVTGIKRVVITASVASIASKSRFALGVIDENTLHVETEGPFSTGGAAYHASKALAFQATKDFIKSKKPAFDVINILPVFVLGGDDTVTDLGSITKGSGGILMRLILGHAADAPITGIGVHIDDVAKMHVLSLDPQIADWAESFEIVKRRFPKEYADA
ncbi:hypothetical protein CDD83_7989 [Cordyceps sp. RAO-2017]|nr:hypothetical protein CDD83_7989 [Cordyceps sp. RAO-2017]